MLPSIPDLQPSVWRSGYVRLWYRRHNRFKYGTWDDLVFCFRSAVSVDPFYEMLAARKKRISLKKKEEQPWKSSIPPQSIRSLHSLGNQWSFIKVALVRPICYSGFMERWMSLGNQSVIIFSLDFSGLDCIIYIFLLHLHTTQCYSLSH